jgi:hypothetical protein
MVDLIVKDKMNQSGFLLRTGAALGSVLLGGAWGPHALEPRRPSTGTMGTPRTLQVAMHP